MSDDSALLRRQEQIQFVQTNRALMNWKPSRALQAECAVIGHAFLVPGREDLLGRHSHITTKCIYCGAEYE